MVTGRRDAAISVLGVNVRFLYTGVFAIGAWLGGLGGVVLGKQLAGGH